MGHTLSISFVIGGLVLIMILTLNIRMGNHAIEITYHGITHSSKHNLIDMIEHDISNIGYNLYSAIENPITVAKENEIEFQSNIYNDPGGSYQTIKWKLSDYQPPNSGNPNHRILYRIIDSDTTRFSSSISTFKLEYYEPGTITPLLNPNTSENRDNINRISISLHTQSNERIHQPGNDNYYTTSTWSKMFTPANLNLD